MSENNNEKLNSILYVLGGFIFDGISFLSVSMTCKALYALVLEKTEEQWREICRREWGLEGEYVTGSFRRRYQGIWCYKHRIVGAKISDSEKALLVDEQSKDKTKYTKNWNDVLKEEELVGRKFTKLMNQCVSCIHLFGCLLMVWILFS
jgi:hypothetical protein